MKHGTEFLSTCVLRCCRDIGTAMLAIVATGVFCQPAHARGDQLHELRLPEVVVETQPELDAQAASPAGSYPVEPVEQLPYHGARHGFVGTTTGGLVFRMLDFRLPGRMPLEFSRVYDSKISDSLPPPPPGGDPEPRWDKDLGRNWIFSYSAYLVPYTVGNDYRMATPEGDVVRWLSQGNGTWLPQRAASKHVILEQINPTTMVATRTDGTEWTFTSGVISGASHGLTRIEDRSGNWVELTYLDGYISEIENSDGSSVTVTRPMWESNPENPTRITKLTDDVGREVSFGYDEMGLLASVTDVLGHTWGFTYYPLNKKLASATDPLDNVYLTASYDTQHRVEVYEANAGPWSFSYLSASTAVSDVFTRTWTYGRDTLSGITTSVTEPTGGTHLLTLDARKNPLSYRPPGAISATTSWVYDTQDRPVSYTPPGLTGAIEFDYDAQENWVDTITGPDGGVTTFERDAAGRVTGETDPEDGTWTATYAANGDLLTLVEPNGNAPGGSGHEWSFSYDGFGNVATATDPTGRVFEFDYTPAGELWKLRRPDRRDGQGGLIEAEWVYGRDASGRIVSVTDPLGHTATRTYDAAGRLTDVEGPQGAHHRYTYDARHRLVSEARLDGASDPTTTYGYDQAGRLVTTTLPDGEVWAQGYDHSSRLTSRADPLGRSWIYTRNVAGRVTSIKFPGDRVVSLTYSSTTGRLTQRSLPGGRVETFSYEPATGRLATAEVFESGGWAGRLEWDYDLMGRPVRIETAIDDGVEELSRELTLSYDANGNRVSLVASPAGESVSYGYDELNRLVSTDSTLHEDWTLSYDPDSGYRTGVTSGARWKNWTCDPAGRLVREAWDWPGESEGDIAYTLDALGRWAVETDAVTGATIESEWNVLGQLVEATRTDTEGTYSMTSSYDLVGRVVDRAMTGGPLGPETAHFEWDAAGRLTYAREGSVIRQFSWEDAPAAEPGAALRMLRTSPSGLDGTGEIFYGFDGRLQRRGEQEWDDPSFQTIESYRWGPTGSDLALEVEQLLADGTVETRRMAHDVGGYYAELTAGFSDLALVHPGIAIDEAVPMLHARRGRTLPAAGAAFEMGAWRPYPRPASGIDLGALAGYATGQGSARDAIATALQAEGEARVRFAEFDLVRSTRPDFIDPWLGHDLTRHIASGPGARSGAGQTLAVAGGGGSATEAGSLPGLNDLGDFTVDQFICSRLLQHAEGGSGSDLCGGGGWDPGEDEPEPDCDYEFQHQGYPLPVRGEDFSDGGVSLLNGELVHTATDLRVFDPGGEIDFTRTYRSGVSYEGTLGYNWLSNWGEMLLVGYDPDTDECAQQLRWIKPDGGYVQYEVGADGTITHPPEALHRLAKISPTEWAISDRSGTMRVFKLEGSYDKVMPLDRLERGANQLQFAYVAGTERLDTIYSNGVARLKFSYEAAAPFRLLRIENAQDPDDYVEYGYYDAPGECGELKEVRRSPTQLGVQGPSVEPVTRYSYRHLNPDDCQNPASANHLLNRIEVRQQDPLAGGGAAFETMQQNLYDNVAFTIRGQCFGSLSCPTNLESPTDADVEYQYVKDLSESTSTTTVIDRRLSPEVREEHVFPTWGVSTGHLIKLTEDQGDLNRVTRYYYTLEGLATKTDLADGSCQLVDYDFVGGIHRPRIVRQRPDCTDSSGTNDLLTYRDYTSVGDLRAVTGPEAFPNGSLTGFDLGLDFYKQYTTFYVYDYEEDYLDEEDPPQDPPDPPCSPACFLPKPTMNFDTRAVKFGFQLPAKLADVNGDPTDDKNTYGNVVKVYRWVPEDGAGRPAGNLEATSVYREDGRLLRKTGPDGVTTEYEYYDSAIPATRDQQGEIVAGGFWDWRQPNGVHGGPVQNGPLALERVVPTSCSVPTTPGSCPAALVTRFAYSAANRLIATQDTQGVVSEDEVAVSGKILSTTICRLGPEETSCTGAGDVLRTTVFVYDLRGRLLEEAVFEPGSSEPIARTWTTYDDLGRPVTTTVDPDPAAVPGTTTPNEAYLQLLSSVVYDDRGRVIESVSPEGRRSCRSYDALDRLKETRQLATAGADCLAGPFSVDDVVAAVDYDALDRPVIETDAEGTKTYRWYDGYGRPEFVSDGRPDQPAGIVVHDPTFLGTPPTLPTQSLWYSQTSYDLESRPVRERFFGRDDGETTDLGFLRVSWREYDTLGRPEASHVWVVEGHVAQADADSLSPPAAGPNRSTLRAYYDVKGRRSKVEDPLGRDTTFSYDAFGRPQTTTLPPSPGNVHDTVTATYDAFGRPSGTISTVFDAGAPPAATTRVGQIAYDGWGRTSRTTGDPAGQDLITELAYDALGRTRTTVRRWSASPPALPQLDADDRVVEVDYDAAGRVTAQRVRESAAPDVWATTAYTYDDDGLVLSMTDAEGNRTDWEYQDELGRVERMLYPLQGGMRQTIEYAEYNQRGQPLEVQYRADNDPEASRVRRTMDYDDRGRLVAKVAAVESYDPGKFFGTTEQSFAWDDLGRMVRATDRSPVFGTADQDIEVRFRYDSAGRKVEENQRLPLNGQLADHFVTSTFDLAGFRMALAFPHDDYTIQFQPDVRGRLATIQAPTDPSDAQSAPAILVEYGHVGGQVWNRSYRNGTELRMYEPDGQGGTTLLYDGLGRPTAMQTSHTGSWTGPALPDFRYGYNRVGELMYEQRRHEPPTNPAGYRTRGYTTDQMGRLRSWAEGSMDSPMDPTTTDPAGLFTSPSDAESWDLDLVGNWQAKTTGAGPSQATDTYVPNALNQYASVQIDGGTPEGLSYDFLGQLRDDESKDKRYTWDLFGRLTKVSVVVHPACIEQGLDQVCEHNPSIPCPNGPSVCEYDTLQSRYRYDALNRRVEVHLPSPSVAMDSVTRYTYDGWRTIEDYAVVGDAQEQTEVVRARYGYGLGLDELLWMDRDVPMNGTQSNPWSGSPDGSIESRFFVHHDLLGSAVATTDDASPAAATMLERFTYSAYGKVEAWHSPGWDSHTGYGGTSFALSKVGLPYLYTGQRYDAVTGLHYYKNRYYDSATGRFLRRDLIGYADGPSLYQYARSNPGMYTDLLGLAVDESGVASVVAEGMHSAEFSSTFNHLDGLPPAVVDVSFRGAQQGKGEFDVPPGADMATVFEPGAQGGIKATVFVLPNKLTAPLIGHELTHILERLQGIKCEVPPAVGPSPCWKTSGGHWETQRGQDAKDNIEKELEEYRKRLKEERRRRKQEQPAVPKSGMNTGPGEGFFSRTRLIEYWITYTAFHPQLGMTDYNTVGITEYSMGFADGSVGYTIPSVRWSQVSAMEGQRNHGSRLEIRYGGVTSANGGGFQGMDDTTPSKTRAECAAGFCETPQNRVKATPSLTH